jgi:murein DD-endopeptidase MepM/ murein hydrolase activator NlpD
MTTPLSKPSADRPPDNDVKQVNIPNAARRGMAAPPSAASKEEAKPLAIDSARQVDDQRLAMATDRNNRVGDSGMALPVAGGQISSPFGMRHLGFAAAFHNGIDLAGQFGTPIVAAADGVVDYADWYYNYGNTVRIVHSDSLVTSYSHMSGLAPGVGPGTRVRKGQLIGYVGSTGRSTGPHLHFCVLVDGRFVNPSLYIGGDGGTEHFTRGELPQRSRFTLPLIMIAGVTRTKMSGSIHGRAALLGRAVAVKTGHAKLLLPPPVFRPLSQAGARSSRLRPGH